MISTTFRGSAAYLLNDSPYGDVRVAVETIATVGASLSNRENRRAFAETLRFSLSFNVSLQGVEARACVGALRDYQLQTVLCPFWPFLIYWGDLAVSEVRPAWWLVFKADWSQWSIFAAGASPSFTPAANDHLVPLLAGRLAGRKVTWDGPFAVEWQVEFTEASDAADGLPAPTVTFLRGPYPLSGYSEAPFYFPFQINASQTDEEMVVRITRDQVGFGRKPLEGMYPQEGAADRTDDYVARGQASLVALLSWFSLHGGGRSFWVSDQTSIVEILAKVPVGASFLSVTDTHLVRPGDFLVFHLPDTPEFNFVVSRNPSEVTLNAPITSGMDPLTTLISRLRLVRFRRPVLNFISNGEGDVEFTLPVLEVPPEINPPADEILGTSLGFLPTRCYLYEFTTQNDLGTLIQRVTSYESAVTFGGNTYTPRIITHGGIRQGLALDANNLSLETAIWDGNPLMSLVTLKSEAPVFLTIREGNISAGAATGVQQLFTGEVLAPRVQGFLLSADCVPLGTVFDQLVPRVIIGPACNWRRGPTQNLYLMSPACSLLRSNWKFTATVTAPGSSGWPFSFGLSGLARVTGPTPAYFDNWFAGGWVEMGSGSTWQRRAITNSTLPIGGQLTVTLSRDLDPFPAAGAAIVLYPTCDGRAETCKPWSVTNPTGKFDNWQNFGGHPFVPVNNPSLTKSSTAVAGGKK